jgi:hypothetical protein
MLFNCPGFQYLIGQKRCPIKISLKSFSLNVVAGQDAPKVAFIFNSFSIPFSFFNNSSFLFFKSSSIVAVRVGKFFHHNHPARFAPMPTLAVALPLNNY